MNGEIVFTETDIGSTGFGSGWSHTRAYNNQLRSFMDRGNGYLWWPENWPFVTTSMYSIASLAVITNSHDIMWFTGSAPNYTVLFGRREQLSHDVTAAEYRLLYPDGTVTVFNDLTHPTRPGAFKQIIAPGGMITTVTPSGTNILEVTREFNGTTESFLYAFNSDGRVEDVTLRRQSGAGPWQYVSKAVYVYYGSSESFGSDGDLKRVERLRWEDASNNWVHLNFSYYRYWKVGDIGFADHGFVHGLKYVLGPAAYQRMVDAGQNPLTGSVGSFADNYFEYDSDQRVTNEITNSGSTSYEMSYANNTDAPQMGQYNHWFRKTTWTYPNSDKRIVFTNIHGASMLEVFQSGTDSSRKWYWFKEYNSAGQVVLDAQPSAITGYDESLNDLVGKQSAGNYTYLRASDGLIRTYTYEGTSGYQAVMTQAAVKQGTGPTHPEIPIRQWTYITNTAGGDTINLVASEKVFPVEGSSANETSYQYTFYTNSNQYQSKKTTWPAVGTDQNGSGSANFMTEYFDQHGYRTSVTNENGIQTAFQYDIVTGAMTRRTDDVSGLALVTDYEFDDQGRTTQALGPVHAIDISGTATSVRQATWTVYDDPEFTVRVGRGYVSGNWSSSSSSVPSSGSSGSSDASGGSSDSSGASGGSSDSSTASGGSSGSGGSQSSGSLPSHFSFPSSSMPSTPSLSYSSSSRSSSTSGSSSGSSGSSGSSSSRSSSSGSSMTSEESSGSSIASGGSSGSSVPSGGSSGGSSGSGGSSFETLVNPVRISIYDAGGKLLEEISATRAWTNGKLLPSDTFAQSSYVRWTTNQYMDCCLVESTRVYHDIPSSGTGSAGTNYTETDFGYDVNKRQNRVKSPGGTITFTELDGLGRRTGVYIGTDDSGGSSDNMVLVASYQYDGGNANGDSNLNKMTQHVDGSGGNDRDTTYEYDWRDRQTKRTLPLSLYETITYDNLDRPTVTEQFEQGTSPAVRAGKQMTYFDSLGRVYRREIYGVSSSGVVGNTVTEDTWYDAIGNVALTRTAGSNLLSKTEYDTLNRPKMRYLGSSDSTTYSALINVANYTVLQQSQMNYDEASNLMGTFSRQRYHNATGTGPLGDPSTSPKARLGYTASWPDGIGRQQAMADYGTNGDPSSRPATIPSSSDTVLVTRLAYDNASRVQDTTDPLGTVTRQEYDDRDRVVTVTENYSPSGGGRVTSTTYAADGGIATLTAENSVTGNQVTTYTYGTTSGIFTSHLLQKVTYPDSTTDAVAYAYNPQAERTTLTDQNGTVHTYEYDTLGRLKHDCVTTLGTNVDGAVRRVSFAYVARGMVQTISSYDNASTSINNFVNQVQLDYNDFNQVVTSYQDHYTTVNTSTTPKLGYTYANGSSNSTRLSRVTYPNATIFNYGYGTTGGLDDAASRVATIQAGAGATPLASYEYLGLGTVARVDYPEPRIENVLADGGTNPDTGDIYTGLDRFGRIIDCRWRQYSSSPATDIERVKYTYDRVGNRLTRQNPVAATTANNVWDEKYTYDALYRLTDTKRGTLSGGSINPLKFEQSWTLDATGNWSQFNQDDTGDGTWDLQQTRTASKVNAITNIGATTGPTWATPAYDAAGNMTTIPKTDAPTTSYTGTYDAWNRLVKLTSGSNTVQENAYDGRGYRTIRKTYTSGTLSETRHFYYTENWQCVEERLGTSPSTASPDRQFVWGVRYIDDLILRDRSISGTLDERLYSQQDANWNVTTLTSQNGAVPQRFGYEDYGIHATLNASFGNASSSFAWEHHFGAYRFDASPQLCLARNRWLSTLLGLWMSRDAIKYLLSTNLFEYVSSNPVVVVDALGLVDELTQRQFFDQFMPLLSKDLPREFPKNRQPWGYTLDAGCIGVSMTLLGYPGAYQRGPQLSRDQNRLADFSNCYRDVAKAKERVIEMTEKNECCRKNGFNIYGGQPRAQLVAFHWNNDAGGVRQRVNIKEIDGRINANEFRDTVMTPKANNLNFDFFYFEEISETWLHANHIDNIPGPTGGTMKIFQRNEKEFQDKIKQQQELFGTLFYCAVCEAEWTKSQAYWEKRAR